MGYRARVRVLLDRHLTGEAIDYRQIVSLFIPILIDQAFIIGMALLNTAMISSSGVAAISAVNMVDSLNIFLISVFVAVSTGGTVIVAQYRGSGNAGMVSRAAASAVTAVSLLALAISVLLVAFHAPLLNLLYSQAEPEVMDNARTYLIGSGLSFTGIAVVEAICGAMRGVGRTRASLALSLIMNLSYVLLNFIFINLLDMGVLGMSIAVNVSRYVAAAIAVYYLLRMGPELRIRLRNLFHVNWEMLKKICRVGVPFAAEQMFFNGGKMITQIFIVGLGTYAIATNAIGNVFAGIIQIPSMAISITAITVVGMCVGSKNIADARKFTKSFFWLSTASLTFMALIVVPLFHPLASLFHPPREIMHNLFVIVVVNAAIQIPLWSMSFILPSVLRAAGDGTFTSVVSLLSMWLFRIVVGYILGIVLGFGIIGIWLAMNIEWGVRGTIFIRRLYGQKWYKHRLVEE